MTKDWDIHIDHHGFQRNGIRGEPFHYFVLSIPANVHPERGLNEEESVWSRDLYATLTVDNEDPTLFNGSCRVISPDRIDEGWMGDEFEERIRKRYKEWWPWEVREDG